MNLFEKICYRHYVRFLNGILKKLDSNDKLTSSERDFLRFICSVIREPSYVSRLTDFNLLSLLKIK